MGTEEMLCRNVSVSEDSEQLHGRVHVNMSHVCKELEDSARNVSCPLGSCLSALCLSHRDATRREAAIQRF